MLDCTHFLLDRHDLFADVINVIYVIYDIIIIYLYYIYMRRVSGTNLVLA